MQAGHVFRVKLIDRIAQGLCQDVKLGIGNAAHLGFDFSDSASCDMPSENAASRRQIILTQTSSDACGSDIWTDGVLMFHAPIAELDSS